MPQPSNGVGGRSTAGRSTNVTGRPASGAGDGVDGGGGAAAVPSSIAASSTPRHATGLCGAAVGADSIRTS